MSTAGQTDAPPDGTRPVAADLPSASRTENKASSDVPSSEAASSDATAPAAAEPGGEGEAEGDAAPDSVDAPDADEQAAQQMQLQVGLLVGIALAAIVGFFFVTTWSQSVSWGGSDSGAGSPSAQGPAASAPAQGGGGPSIGGGSAGSNAPPLETLVEENASGSDGQAAAGVTAQADSLQRVVDQNDGVRRRQARQELVNLYIGAGQLGEAALTQRRMAETSGDPADWRRTGDLLYSWMETIEDRGTKAQVAPRVVEAYERVLAENPDNLDVRTDMATALLQTNNPMRGVEEINRVLKQDSTHFQARFNKGIMLTMIGRVDQAIEQFELVKRIVGEESPYFEQANQAIQTIQQQEQGGGSAGQQGVPTSPAPDPAGNTTSDTPAPER
jgi:tetratricopeptide (TPR) repeat protein